MRVLHIFHEIKYSGAEIMYANAAKLFNSHNIDLFAISTGENIGEFSLHFEECNIKVFHRPLLNSNKNPIKLINYIISIVSLIKEYNITTLHIHRASFIWLFALCGYIANINTVFTAHNVFKHRKHTWVKGFLERYFITRILRTKFHTIGESVYNNELNYYKNGSVRINNWVDNEKFFPASLNERTEIKRQLNIDHNTFVIISVGSCTSIKNHHDIIKALSLIVKSGHQIVYLHLGTGCTEDQEIQLANELGILNHIKFIGNTTEVRNYLIVSDIYIMTSQFEGLAISAIEAMACGLPSILYNVDGLKDLIYNNNNGFLIKPDYNSLYEAIVSVIKDKNIINSMKENAIHFVNTHFNMNINAREIIKLYK